MSDLKDLTTAELIESLDDVRAELVWFEAWLAIAQAKRELADPPWQLWDELTEADRQEFADDTRRELAEAEAKLAEGKPREPYTVYCDFCYLPREIERRIGAADPSDDEHLPAFDDLSQPSSAALHGTSTEATSS